MKYLLKLEFPFQSVTFLLNFIKHTALALYMLIAARILRAFFIRKVTGYPQQKNS